MHRKSLEQLSMREMGCFEHMFSTARLQSYQSPGGKTWPRIDVKPSFEAFEFGTATATLLIASGRYYVVSILCQHFKAFKHVVWKDTC